MMHFRPSKRWPPLRRADRFIVEDFGTFLCALVPEQAFLVQPSVDDVLKFDRTVADVPRN